MKKYRVSLAVKVPSNLEVEVCANTEKEALEKALEKYENGEFDGDNVVGGLCWDDAELSINKKIINDTGSGIYIEKI